MKESNNISDLFAKAANEPVHTSFDETKKLFLATLPVNSSASGSKSGLLTKKWIIMLSIFTTGVLITALYLSSPKGEPQKSQTRRDSIAQTEQQSNKTATIAERDTKKNLIKSPRPELPSGYLAPKPLEVLWNTPLLPIGGYQIDKPERNHKDVYRLPTLTESEKKENEKRKKDMVKSLFKANKHEFAYVPSGTISIDSQNVSIQSFIIQKYEVSNIEYKTFLFDLLIQERNDDFMKAKPDQKKWTELLGEGMKTMENNYFSNDAYNNYPVVNVSREGAEMYCFWLSKQLHAYTDERGASPLNDIRLPYRSEWIYAANSGVDSRIYPWDGDSITNETGCSLANRFPETGNYADDGGFDLVKKDSYNPNDFGLFCMSGNAAEMVYDSKDGTIAAGTAGGSWMDSAESLKINAEDTRTGLTKAHPSVGFRVVMTYFNN